MNFLLRDAEKRQLAVNVILSLDGVYRVSRKQKTVSRNRVVLKKLIKAVFMLF